MSDLKVNIYISFQDWGLIENCMRYVEEYIDNASRIAGKPLDDRDKYFVQWIHQVRTSIENQVKKSSYNSTPDIVQRELTKLTDTIPEFLGVLEGVDKAMAHYLSS